MSDQVIRKLGALEQYFHDQIELNGTVSASAFLFTSQIDLFAHKNVIAEAVNLWKQTQPFLRSKVHVQDESNKFFAYASDDKIQNVDNVTYLYYKSTNGVNESSKDYWKLLIEREYTIPINWQDGLMWRLTFVKIDNNQNEAPFEYCLLITATHALFDGHSAFVTVARLFSLIEGIYSKNIFKVKDAAVAPSMEEHVHNHLKTIDSEIAKFNKIGGFKRPDSFIVKNAETDRKLYIPVDISGDGAFFSDIDHSEYASLKSLLEISKNSATKFYCNTFKGDKFKQFLSKSKSLNAKITGVFNAMFIIAWRMVHQKLSNEPDAKSQQINYTTIVNLRPYLKDSDQSSLVWLCNSLYSSFDQEIDFEAEDFWSVQFWTMARNESESFHSRIKKGEQFRLHESLAPIDSGECRIHYGLSNLVIPNQIADHLKMCKLNEVYTLSSYRSMWKNDFGYHNIISIGESLCWVMSYNSYFVRNEAVKLFVDSVMQIYENICSF